MFNIDQFYHSVTLDKDLCKGCINCIKHCPTEAIRVRDGKASIIKEFCIDCGECVRVCPHHAKKVFTDSTASIDDFEYKIALPAPSLYAQFNNLTDVNIVLRALVSFGFDDVFEVAAAAEIVSHMTKQYIKENSAQKPFISTACPCVVRLIRVRFPNLIDHLLPIKSPMEVAAAEARRIAMEKTGLPSEKIGLFFLSPCPAKMTAVYAPLDIEHSNVDRVLAIKDIYPLLLPHMKATADDEEVLALSGQVGIAWGSSGGEANGLTTDHHLAADGIVNVIKVLEDLEDEKIAHLDFIELNACSGGCVGGVLQVENPYLAKSKLRSLRKNAPQIGKKYENKNIETAFSDRKIEYKPVFKLGENISDSLLKLSEVESIYERLPGLDCGSCGAPTCKALAEDVVRGLADEKDCIHLFREYVSNLQSADK